MRRSRNRAKKTPTRIESFSQVGVISPVRAVGNGELHPRVSYSMATFEKQGEFLTSFDNALRSLVA